MKKRKKTVMNGYHDNKQKKLDEAAA